MDNSSLCGTSDSGKDNTEAICSCSASLGDHDTIDKLTSGLSGELKINDGNRTNTVNDVRSFPVKGYYIEEEEEEEEDDEDDFSEEALLAQMGYAKSEPKRDYDEEEEEEEEDLSEDSLLAQMGYLKNEPPKHEPITTPTADLNLVSAFKGSREKEGKPPKECRVSWAPDVYDPPCTSAEHLALSNTETHKSVQKVKGLAGKNRQKSSGKGAGAIEVGGGGGKGSRGGDKGTARGGKAAGKNKDRKQADKKAKKHGGSASKYSNHDED